MAIILLDTKTINRIAAGEVIERPASVVKELVENAIDAGSSEIEIKIESGGRNLITVTDDGNGIEKEDLELAFMRHATSKLSDSELIEIKHLGFRGEALPSIAAVSRMKLSSKASGAKEAWSIRYEGGEKIEEVIPCSLLQGTYIEVRDLFFATPNRLKFLKTERAETQAIVDIVNNLAMINYSIGFTLTSSNKKLLKYVKQTSLFNRLCETEEEFQNNSLEVKEGEESIKLTGHICKPTINRGNSTQIYTFVNRRPIKDRPLFTALLSSLVAANIVWPLLLYVEGGISSVQKFYQNAFVGLSLLIGSSILALSVIFLGVHYYRKTNCTNLVYCEERIEPEKVNGKFIEEIKEARTKVLEENHSKDAKCSSLTLEQVVVESHNYKDVIYSIS